MVKTPIKVYVWVGIAVLVALIVGLKAATNANGIASYNPKDAEQLYYLIASLAVVLGGVWAFVTWVHNETIRRFREIPSMEMTIEFQKQRLPNGMVLLEINAVANNSGVIPIPVDLPRLWLRIEKRPTPNEEGLLLRKSDPAVIDQNIARPGIAELTLEPMTRTVVTEYFAAEPETLYGITVRIPFKGDGRATGSGCGVWGPSNQGNPRMTP